MEGKPKLEVFLGVWVTHVSLWSVRNKVFDEESNSTTRTRLRSVILEERVIRERYEGVRDVLRKESFCESDYVWFVSGNMYGKICQIRAKAPDV